MACTPLCDSGHVYLEPGTPGVAMLAQSSLSRDYLRHVSTKLAACRVRHKGTSGSFGEHKQDEPGPEGSGYCIGHVYIVFGKFLSRHGE